MEHLTKDQRDELGDKIDEDIDIGQDILNEVIPAALEIYFKLDCKEFNDIDSEDSIDN